MPATVTVGPRGGTHDLSLTDSDSVTTGFLVVGEDNTLMSPPQILISRERTSPPREAGGVFRYSDLAPEVDLVWDIETFHHGALSNRWTPQGSYGDPAATPNAGTAGRYNQANAVDARSPGEFGIANEIYRLEPYLDSTNFAVGADWTLAGSASIGSSTLTLTTVGAEARQALNSPTVYRSRAITIVARVTVTGTAATMLLGFDIDGSIVGNTSSTSVSTTNAIITHTLTPGAAINTIGAYIEHDAGASTTVTCDWIAVFNTNAVPPTVGGLMEFDGSLYGAWGAAVMRLGSGAQFDAVLIGPAACTGLGISPTDNRLLAGFGASGYYHSTDGTTWTLVSNAAGGGPYATSRNRVWSIQNDSTVNSATDVTTPTWTAYNNIGTNTRDMTGLFVIGDAPVIAKEDGLWLYDRAANAFRDMTPEYKRFPHPDNFTVGHEFNGWLYLGTRRGIVRFDGFDTEDLSQFFQNPAITEFGGRLKALASDGNWAYAFTDTPTTDASTTKETWLLPFDEVEGPNGEQIIVHTLQQMQVGDVRNAVAFYDGTNPRLIFASRRFVGTAGGTDYYQPFAAYTRLPLRHEQAARDISPDLGLSTSGIEPQALITQYWDGLLPDAVKSWTRLTFRTDGTLDSGKRVLVEQQVNEDTSWTSAATISAAGAQTVYFNTLAAAQRSGRRIRFRFRLETDSATAGPRVIMPIVLHAVYRPTPLRRFEFTVMVGNNLPLRNGAKLGDDVTGATLLTRLDAYLTNAIPLTLAIDEDGDGTTTSYNVFVRDVSQVRQVQHPTDPSLNVWLYRVVATEQLISA